MDRVYFKQFVYGFNPLQRKTTWKNYELGEWIPWEGGEEVKILIVQNIKTGHYRKVEIEEVWRSSIEPTIGDHINREEIITKIIEKKFNRPYFGMKVVKVKKVEVKPRVKTLILKRANARENKGEDRYARVKINDPKLYLYRHENSKVGDEAVYPNREIWKIIEIIEPKQPKGNWVNGENLDKIKFPVPCSYRSHTGKKRYALLNKDKNNGKDEYQLSRIFQDTCSNFFLASDSLKKLIRKWDIHILKGKIIIFEEE